jgi:protein PET100
VYFGTNLDRRFTVPDFWPKPEQTHRIPFEREEISSELERLKAKRLYLREKRLAAGMERAERDGSQNDSSGGR